MAVVSSVVAGAAIVGSTVAGVAQANAQRKAAKNARKSQAGQMARQIDLQEEQFAYSKQFGDIGLGELEKLQGELGDFDVSGEAQSRVQDALAIANPQLAATGNLRSGVAQDLTLREGTRQLFALDRERFNRRLNLGQLATGTNVGLTGQANQLQAGINQSGSNIANLQLAQGAANPWGPVGQGLGQLGGLALMYGGGFFGGNTGSGGGVPGYGGGLGTGGGGGGPFGSFLQPRATPIL
jgi:hypothetical protein